jgi:Zn-dependent peptidase ImmA (M78 family)
MRIEEKLEILNMHTKKVPVETISLANNLGIHVYYVDWPTNASGKIEREAKLGGKSGLAIFVNKNHHPNRRRFTIAHELAHFILHPEQIGDGIFDDGLYRSGLSTKTEAEANKMAADILMPRPVLREKIAAGLNSVKALADEFKVSPSAMSIRLGIPCDE